VPGRALVGSLLLAAAGTVWVGLLAGFDSGADQWDLPMSPVKRPGEVPIDHRPLCTELDADSISIGCETTVDGGGAEVVVIPQPASSLRDEYGPLVNGDTIRWIGVNRFPAVQLASTGGDGYAICRIAVDTAPNQVLLVVYRQEAADPKLPPCAPARDYAAHAISVLRPRTQ
jgi:hypothetical protein